MPNKVLPSAATFMSLFTKLERLGFRRITPHERRVAIERLALVAPRKRPGREVGYTYIANHLEVVVWTTYIEEEGRARDTDAGWVLILDGDRIAYSTRPKSRTAGFIDRLLRYARIAQLRVDQRPLCPVCHGYMRIVHGSGLKSCYWSCRSRAHKGAERLSFDHGLPPKALEFLKGERKDRARSARRIREAGKEPGAALTKRLRWGVGRPENRVP